MSLSHVSYTSMALQLDTCNPFPVRIDDLFVSRAAACFHTDSSGTMSSRAERVVETDMSDTCAFAQFIGKR